MANMKYRPLVAGGAPPTWASWRRAVAKLIGALLSLRVRVVCGFAFKPSMAWKMFRDRVRCATCNRQFRLLDCPNSLWVDDKTLELAGECFECGALAAARARSKSDEASSPA